jgi:hypothetical protein
MLVGTSVFAQDIRERDTEIAEAIAIIKRELSESNLPSWVGEYYHGDGLGTNLSLFIAPKAGIAYQWHGCLGLYEQNCGSIKTTDSDITVRWKYDDDDRLHDAVGYIPIRWGKDSFLVIQSEILSFCADARSLEPNLLSSMRRKRKDGGRPSGVFELPEKYEKFRKMDHLSATIVAINAPSEKLLGKVTEVSQKVTLGIGEDSGLLVGMKLYMAEPAEKGFSMITIESVEKKTSQAVAKRYYMENEFVDPLVTGKHFTTNWFAAFFSRLPRTQ